MLEWSLPQDHLPSFTIHSESLQAYTDRVGPLAFANVLVAPNSAVLE